MSSPNQHYSSSTLFYEALGQIVVSFDTLERTIEALIFCAMNSSVTKTKILFSRMEFTAKVSLMSSVLEKLHTNHGSDDFRISLNAFVERSHYCEEQRNYWIRSHWVPEIRAGSHVVNRLVSCKCGESEFKLEPISLKVLEGFIVSLNSTILYLQAFHQKLFIRYGQLRGRDSLNEYLLTPLSISNDSY